MASSLGCPQEGMGHDAALVPGRRLTFSHQETPSTPAAGTSDPSASLTASAQVVQPEITDNGTEATTVAIRSNWRAEAADLIQIELQQKLRHDFDIVKVEPDSFLHEGQEIRYVTGIFKKGHPRIDTRRFNQIEFDIYNLLEERGFDPVPTIDYRDEGPNGD